MRDEAPTNVHGKLVLERHKRPSKLGRIDPDSLPNSRHASGIDGCRRTFRQACYYARVTFDAGVPSTDVHAAG